MGSIILETAALVAKALPDGMRRRLYRLGPVTRGLRGLLNAAAAEGLTDIEIAAGPLVGTRMRLDLRTEKDLWLGTYELELLQAIENLAAAGMVAYDVGANLGYVSLAIARAVGPSGQVVAFEPLRANFDRLCVHLEMNAEGSRVRPVEAAVGVRTTRSQFLAHASATMGKLEGSSGRALQYTVASEVEVISLDDWVYQQGELAPGLVKIDVEGGEVQVLKGMERLLGQARPYLLVELHGPEVAGEAQGYLERTGYRLHEILPGYLPWRPGRRRDYVVGIPPGSSVKAPIRDGSRSRK